MATNNSRSMKKSLLEGSTDGKYIKDRPDTETDRMNGDGDKLIKENRQSLNPLNGYQTVGYPAPIAPAEAARANAK